MVFAYYERRIKKEIEVIILLLVRIVISQHILYLEHGIESELYWNDNKNSSKIKCYDC